MQAVSAGWPAAIVRGHTIGARASVLDYSLTPIAGGTLAVAAGEVINDRSQPIRRSGRLSVKNVKGALTPWGQDSLIQLGYVVRVEVGAWVGGGPEWKIVATLLPDDPETSTGTSLLDMGGRDRLKLAAESDFIEPTRYLDDDRVAVIIRQIAQDAGMGTDDDLYDLDDGGRLLGVETLYEAARNRLDAMRTIADDNGLELFCAATGELVLRPLVDPATVEPVAIFGRGDGVRTLGVRRGWRDRVKNHVVVVGDGVRSELEVTDTNSPIHRSRIGDHVEWYRSDGIVWQDQADRVAASLLPQVALIEEEIAIEGIPDPALEAGDVIQIDDPVETRASGKFILEYAPIPLGVATSSLLVRRVQSLL